MLAGSQRASQLAGPGTRSLASARSSWKSPCHKGQQRAQSASFEMPLFSHRDCLEMALNLGTETP